MNRSKCTALSITLLVSSFTVFTQAGEAAKPATVAPGLEESINPMARVARASDMASWLNRDNLKKNQTIDVLGEVTPATGKDKAAICMMKIYIMPPPPPSPPPPAKGAKPAANATPPPPPPAPKAKTCTFAVYSDDKAIGAYLKVLFKANLSPTITLQGQFDDKDDAHKTVEEWKIFRATKFLSTSATLAQAKQANEEREKKAAEIKKQIADDMKGPVAGLERNGPPPPKKPETKKPEDKKLADEEK